MQTGGAAGVCVSKVNSSARQPVMTPATVCESVCLERFYTKASLPLPTVFLKLLCGKQRNNWLLLQLQTADFGLRLSLSLCTCQHVFHENGKMGKLIRRLRSRLKGSEWSNPAFLTLRVIEIFFCTCVDEAHTSYRNE